MKAFRCATCGQLVFFDNSQCLRCGSLLGFDPASLDVVTIAPTGDPPWWEAVGRDDRPRLRQCANLTMAACNWVVPEDDPVDLCRSCRLTRTRPNDAETDAMVAFAEAEQAKRRLLAQLLELGLPVEGDIGPPGWGLRFDLLSSRGREVTIGHEDGVITLDLSESDDAHREFVRLQLGEPYRTVLGHLRHEIGHYYWPMLVEDGGRLEEFRSLFGDERLSYEEALDRHYSSGPAADWVERHVSQYATMHPWEDWAETFAHHLHIDAGLETAEAFGLRVGEPAVSAAREVGPSLAEAGTMDEIVERWLALTYALNAMARSVGQDDVYPFVLAPTVIAKLAFVRDAIGARATQDPHI